MESDKIVPQFLGLHNYETWSRCTESYLKGEDLWEAVGGENVSIEKEAKALEVIKDKYAKALEEAEALEDAKAQEVIKKKYAKALEDAKALEVIKERDAKALEVIKRYCGSDIRQVIDFNEFRSAKDLWYRLASDFNCTPQPVDQYHPLYHDFEKAGNPKIRQLIESETVPGALGICITPYRQTILHIATILQQENVVKDLVKKLTLEDLKQKDDIGDTALSLAAYVGNEKIARYIVESCPQLVKIENGGWDIPVVVAVKFRHKSTAWYLYSETPEEYLNPDHPTSHGTSLLVSCIKNEFFDIALHLAKRFPKLASGREKSGVKALQMLASKPLAFRGGKDRVFWEQWIYSCMPVKLPSAASRGDLETGHEGQTKNQEMIARAYNRLHEWFWKLLLFPVPGGKDIYEEKLKHLQVRELLSYIIHERMQLDTKALLSEYLEIAFSAAESGISKIIYKIADIHPEVLNIRKNGQTLFSIAASRRQKNVFTLLQRRDAGKVLAAFAVDKNGNSVLHHVATLVPSSQLDRISGAALQMQRELQWFQEVEKLVQPMLREEKNAENKTPRELFTESHQKLKEDGEKWMKDVATSCSVVAALIVTIMFAAIFTSPGGTDGRTGAPFFLGKNAYVVFVMSDAASFFSAATSLLMFLRILTSRCREEDFLKSLPLRLIIGLSTLFFSIATMMMCFGAAFDLVFYQRMPLIYIPIIVVASIPVILFAFLQFPLLVEIALSMGWRLCESSRQVME